MEATPPCRAWFVGDDPAAREAVCRIWGAERAHWTFFNTGSEAAGGLLNVPPDILLCSGTLADMTGFSLAKFLKEENVYSQVPVVLCLSEKEIAAVDNWSECMADDFIVFPGKDIVHRATLELALNRATRTLDVNPLTRLPGNTSIIRRTQGLIDQNQDFAFGYCDLDNFKPFNDKYGFSRGDEVLMMTSRILLNSVHALEVPFSFVGHIGGDDYVFIVPIDVAELVCRKIVVAFDDIIPHFYDEEDRERNCIVSLDRQNRECSFPLMAMSIAVAFNLDGSLKHFGEASSRAMSLKKEAKKSTKSSYALERRRAPQ